MKVVHSVVEPGPHRAILLGPGYQPTDSWEEPEKRIAALRTTRQNGVSGAVGASGGTDERTGMPSRKHVGVYDRPLIAAKLRSR